MAHPEFDKSFGVKFRRELPPKHNWEKQSKKGFWTSIFVEFCKRTDLHGYKYIVMEELSAAERGSWVIAVLVSTAIAAYFVVTAYKWYARNPIVTVIESTQGAIWDVPFPAVTICDLNTISRKAAMTFAKNIKLPGNVTTDFVFESLRLAPLLHSTFVTTLEQKEKLYVLQDVLDSNKISLETMFRTLSPAASCNQLVQRCMWKNTIYRCDQLFQQVFIMFSLCCSFNYYALPKPNEKSESTEDKLFHLSQPRRVASCGYQTALTVLLNMEPDDYYSAMIASHGALVFIDSAYNVPNDESPVRMVNPSTEVLIALSPERTYATKGVQSFTPAERECYYTHEVHIPYLRRYSLHNCVAVQRMQIIKKICECVPFFFPYIDYPRICNFYDLECLEMALRPGNDLSESENMFECLPECEHYDYPIEVAMGKLANNVNLSGLPFFNNLNLANRSLLNVFFNDLVSTRYRRDVYLNWQNILAAFGGLLSLMLGFTLISGVDLILFFTLQLAYEVLPEHTTNKTKKKTVRHEHDRRVNNWLEKSIELPSVTDKEHGMLKSERKRYRY